MVIRPKGLRLVQLEGFVEVSAILRCGVYALVAKGVVIYVGKSKAMLARINTHRRIWIDKRKGQESWMHDKLGIPGLLFDEVHIQPCRPDEVDALETRMINLYKPRYNTQLKTSAKITAPISVTIAGKTLSLNSGAQSPQLERRV